MKCWSLYIRDLFAVDPCWFNEGSISSGFNYFEIICRRPSSYLRSSCTSAIYRCSSSILNLKSICFSFWTFRKISLAGLKIVVFSKGLRVSLSAMPDIGIMSKSHSLARRWIPLMASYIWRLVAKIQLILMEKQGETAGLYSGSHSKRYAPEICGLPLFEFGSSKKMVDLSISAGFVGIGVERAFTRWGLGVILFLVVNI